MSFAKAEKLLDLATFAASRRQGVTLDDIVARYDISLRTAQRMLKALELRFPNAEFWYDDEGKNAAVQRAVSCPICGLLIMGHE